MFESEPTAMFFCMPEMLGVTIFFGVMQVESLLEGPRLQHKLDNERSIIQSLNMM
jgi:hypothetical protein